MADWIDMITMTGASPRQVDWWTRSGWLKPDNAAPGSGRQRIWPYAEFVVCRTMARLVSAGLTVEAAHKVARGDRDLAPGVTVLVSPDLESMARRG